jgi:putative sigma-54 modulation protein
MSMTIAGRHVDITPGLRSHVEQKLEKLSEHFEKDFRADVVLCVEKNRHTAEITVHLNGLHVHGRETSEDMYSSVDNVFEKLEKQVRKYKNRISKAKSRERMPLHELEHHLLELTEPLEDEVPETDTPVAAHRIIEREPMEVNPLTVDEAVLQLELRDYDFLVFSNSDSGKVNVVYKRSDERYGLIVPPN